ncbi:TIGR02217 family protein [Altererythrobacter aestiaquae]|uniref:TIGR02217 family protein n=1 Tax=Pontixanthobacter aestiaquae TaxID=1509367 RepID=A0A844Z1Y0_9SPHN|nr:TIGR02217 family protein [Pontixanthobacter aestiaquae]
MTDLREPLDQDQTDLLDQAGAILAQSTLDLAQAVRNATNGPAEILLLAFTPTILDPEMPEAKRANVPLGWAWPAFDRLQLEDYDWLTAGADANRRAAYAEFDQRLGYPTERQDYLSGFVLTPDDADEYWRRIDAGLDEAARRGITKRYVWALPQISRDGYTRLALSEEDDVQAFDDVLYPLALGRDAGVSPGFSTTVAVTASGHERRNSLWSDARLRFDVGPGIRSENELGTLIAFFRARRGAARGFRLTDPFDFSSNAMTGAPNPTDQNLGTGDGITANFALIKSYGDGDEPQIRPITRPRLETLTISIDGEVASDWSWNGDGSITFTAALPEGAIVTAGFLFDVPVRF